MMRTGRQELLFGDQRAVSPLDWANTRRTFEGGLLTWSSKDWKLDGFWTHPVQVDPNRFDSPDRDQEFMGIHSSYKLGAEKVFDAYFFRYLNGRGTNDFKANTVGMRWRRHCGDYLWDFEGAYQFGETSNGSDDAAGMATFGVGRNWSDCIWNPTLWLYYDWASGGNVMEERNGYHHLFPLAHKYNGFMDLFGRRNLEDVNMLLTLKSNQRLELFLWYHYLFLETKSDTPYSVAMTPFNPGNLPGSASLGHEIDLIADWKIGKRQSLLFGYSHFFSGAYYSTTAGVPFTGDADFFYTQWTLNF